MGFRIRQIATVMFAMGGLATLSFNCAPTLFKPAEYNLSSSSFEGEMSGAFDKPDAPYALMTADQTFQSMLNVTGQTATSAQSSEYTERAGALAGEDSLTVINAPLMMAATSLAGEVCNGLITKEAALNATQRRFFSSVNFSQPVSMNSGGVFTAAASSLANAFWGRDINGEEGQLLTAYYTDFVGSLSAQQMNQAAQTRNLYLGLCAAMLSAFDAYTY